MEKGVFLMVELNSEENIQFPRTDDGFVPDGQKTQTVKNICFRKPPRNSKDENENQEVSTPEALQLLCTRFHRPQSSQGLLSALNMKSVQSAARLFKPTKMEILRGIQTANQKQSVAAAAMLDVADTKTEWDLAKPYSAIPGPKPLPIPYVGNLWRLLPVFTDWGKNMLSMHRDLYDTYGSIVKLSGMGRQDMILLFHPDDVEKMFRNESTWPERMSLGSLKYYRTVIRKDFYGDTEGLVTSNGENWQKFRSATNQTMMQPKNVIMYLDSVQDVVEDFIERVRYIRLPNDEMPDDFINELNKLALESFGMVSLDVRLGCLENNLSPDSEAMKMINNVKDVIRLMFVLEFGGSPWKFISTPAWREFVQKMDEILEITVKHTYAKWEEIKKRGEDENVENRSILETLLLKTKDPKIPIVMTSDTLFAGIDTTSNTTATFLYFLATNPDKQEKVFQEVRALLPTKDARITKKIFNELRYTRAAIKESMRLKPTTGANQRVTKKDLVMSGYQIPAGISLISGHQIMCQLEENFKDANKYIPERWLRSETNYTAANPFVYLPFGFGHRSCIGKRFAEMEMELVLAKVIRNFEVSYHHEPMTWTSLMLSSPNKPLRFKMTERPE